METAAENPQERGRRFQGQQTECPGRKLLDSANEHNVRWTLDPR